MFDAFVDQTRDVYIPKRDDVSSFACETSRSDNKAPSVALDVAMHGKYRLRATHARYHMLFNKIQVSDCLLSGWQTCVRPVLPDGSQEWMVLHRGSISLVIEWLRDSQLTRQSSC